MAEATLDKSRRRLLIGTGVVGGAGVAVAIVPFVMSFWPSARAKAAGAPIEVDISKIEPGQKIDVEWRGKVCWLVNRTKPMLDSLPKLDARLADPNSNVPQQPANCKNEHRSIKEAMWVAVGICTHLGCSPTFRPEIAPADLGRRLAGRLLLSVPPVEIRPGRTRLQGRAGADEPRHSAAQVPVRHAHRDRHRRRRQGSLNGAHQCKRY